MWDDNPWRWLKGLQAETVVCCAPGNQCRAGQSLQQQAEEAVEAVEVCRMLRKEGKWDGGMGSQTHQSFFSGFAGYQVEQRNVRNVFPFKTILEGIWDVLLSIRWSSDISDLPDVLNTTSRLLCKIQLQKKSAFQQILVNLKF